jgi:RimJ/RimL family protein N-acetyltransferase
MIPLQTDRLAMRALALEDADNIEGLDADPEVREFLEMPEPTTREEALQWIAHLNWTYPEGSVRGFWAAEESGRFVGWFHLRPAEDSGECELGYRLRRDAWGRGLATEGSRALIELAGERVIARTMKTNLRSRRVMEKLGMEVIREFAYSGTGPPDDVEYGTPSRPEASVEVAQPG